MDAMNFHNMLRDKGTLITGSYIEETGHIKQPPQIVGLDEDPLMASTMPPKPLTGPGKKGRQKKVVGPVPRPSFKPVPVPSSYYEEVAAEAPTPTPILKAFAPPMRVDFKTGMGTIRHQAASVYRHELGLGILFNTEDDIHFEPNIGDKFSILIDKTESFLVFYTGLLFDLPNSTQKLMIFMLADSLENSDE